MRPSSYFILVTSGHILSLRLRGFSSPGAQFERVSTANIRCCRATHESHCNCPSCKAYVKSLGLYNRNSKHCLTLASFPSQRIGMRLNTLSDWNISIWSLQPAKRARRGVISVPTLHSSTPHHQGGKSGVSVGQLTSLQELCDSIDKLEVKEMY